jgi:hypothetical protein
MKQQTTLPVVFAILLCATLSSAAQSPATAQ